MNWLWSLKRFFTHYFQILGQLLLDTGGMLSVFAPLLNHSYLSGQMQDMAQMSKFMPPEVKEMLRKVGHVRRNIKSKVVAPIP